VTAPMVERVAADLPEVYDHWHWWHGQLVPTSVDDADLRECHVPVVAEYEGYPLGGRR